MIVSMQIRPPADLKDTFYNLVARANMGTVLSYAYMHWRTKAQEMRAGQ
jgi:hypothetical protein